MIYCPLFHPYLPGICLAWEPLFVRLQDAQYSIVPLNINNLDLYNLTIPSNTSLEDTRCP